MYFFIYLFIFIYLFFFLPSEGFPHMYGSESREIAIDLATLYSVTIVAPVGMLQKLLRGTVNYRYNGCCRQIDSGLSNPFVSLTAWCTDTTIYFDSCSRRWGFVTRGITKNRCKR